MRVEERPQQARIECASYGVSADGQSVELYTLSNADLVVRIMTYGATVVSILTPDRDGRVADVVLGFDSLAPYLRADAYFGSVIGRYVNRIANGEFTLRDAAYRLCRNDGCHHLHGGMKGYDKVIWHADAEVTGSTATLNMRYRSKDGEEGYPGNLDIRVAYTLSGGDLRIDYHAGSDAPTIVNLTNHSYFSLAGTGDVLGHELEIAADHFLPVSPTLIPTGEQKPVGGTAFDFRRPSAIGSHFRDDDTQLHYARGYDHTWVLNRKTPALERAARVLEPQSGRAMTVYTTQSGLQFYSGNFLDGSLCGRQGQRYAQHAGFCLETQHFPDSPNQPAFPSTVLVPPDEYRAATIYRFRASFPETTQIS